VTTYPWTRFWVRRSGNLDLSDGGYLFAPEHREFPLSKGDMFTTADLQTIPCLALLGEPGIGKTTALQSLVAANEGSPCHVVDLRTFSTDSLLREEVFSHQELGKWAAGTGEFTLFLDSLDECLVHIRPVSNLLLKELRKLPVSRLRLRIACRTAEWPEVLSAGLRELWPDHYEEVELAPLRRKDVRAAAELQGIDADAFLREAHRLEMVPFASRPITLDFLLRQSRDTGRLPDTVTELYEKGCRALAAEWSPGRHASRSAGRLTADQRLRVASQIAAVCLLTGRPTILGGSGLSATDSDVTIDDLPFGTVDTDGRVVERDDVREVLDTGLFSGRAGHRLGFSHWTFGEFLTARFCADLDDEQVASLVLRRGLDGRDRAIPQLREVVGWLTASRTALRDRIIAGDPQAALHGGLSACDSPTRKSVTESLLRLAVAGQVVDLDLGLRSRYHVLKHEGLADELRPFVLDRSAGVITRRIAIDIAEACDCNALVEDLLSVSLDRSEDIHTRSQAAYAVLRLADETQKLLLRPLLNTTEAEDPQDELRGVALTALWPSHLTAAELFERHLTIPRQDNFLGSYGSLIYHLEQQLTADQLPFALRWVAARPPDHHDVYKFRSLAGGIMRRAWQYLDHAPIRVEFSRAGLQRLRHYDQLLPQETGLREQESPFDKDINNRRIAIEGIVGEVHSQRLDSDARRGACLARLARPDDFPWLVTQYLDTPASGPAEVWLDLVDAAFVPERLEHGEALDKGIRASPRFRQRMARWIDPVEISSKYAAQLREYHSWSTPTPKTKTHARPPAQILAERWLERAETGDSDAWWRLNLELSPEPDSDYYGDEHQSDLTQLAGWKGLDDATRQRCLGVGMTYVRLTDPAEDVWLGTQTFYRPAAAGYRALRLAQTMGREDLLIALDAGTWGKWIAAILAFWESSEDVPAAQVLISIAYQSAPDAVHQAVDRIVTKCDERVIRQALLKLPADWPPALAHAMLERMRKGTLSGSKAGLVWPHVLSTLPREGREFVMEVVNHRSQGELQAVEARIAAAAILTNAPESAWDFLWPVLQDDEQFGRAVIEHLAERQSLEILQHLGETTLADLYLWLRKLIPGERMTEAGYVTAREASIRLRDAILERLKTLGTQLAVVELERIAELCTEAPWLNFTVIEAEDNRLRNDWEPLSIAELKRLAGDQRSRVVATDEQLLQLVETSLSRLQQRLQGETPAVIDLWNDAPRQPRNESHLSDYLKRHLEIDLGGSAVVVNREVELRKTDETDIRVDAVRAKDPSRISVLVEVKGCWNDGVDSDMERQLRDRYMRNSRIRCGLYVVGWYSCSAWDATDYRQKRTKEWTLETARAYFGEQARQLSCNGMRMRAVVLDLAFPGISASRGGSR